MLYILVPALATIGVGNKQTVTGPSPTLLLKACIIYYQHIQLFMANFDLETAILRIVSIDHTFCYKIHISEPLRFSLHEAISMIQISNEETNF